MERVKGLIITLLAVFLAFMPQMECHVRLPVPNRPFCISQLAILNNACSRLPVSPLPPPSPPTPDSPPSPDDKEGHGHRNGHGHGHRNNRQYQQTPAEEECCKWLKEVDADCICQLLIHLPTFLTRPAHQFKLIVDESCDVTFTCEGRIRL